MWRRLLVLFWFYVLSAPKIAVFEFNPVRLPRVDSRGFFTLTRLRELARREQARLFKNRRVH